MKNKKKKLYYFLNLVVFLGIFSFFNSASAAGTADVDALYSSGNLAGQSPSGGLEPNTSVLLTYTLNGATPCSTGNDVYYALWDAQNSKMISTAHGKMTTTGFTYEFTTGNPQPPASENYNFVGYFYCFSSDRVNAGSGVTPADLNPSGLAWTSPAFQQSVVIRRYICDSVQNACVASTNSAATDLTSCNASCIKYQCVSNACVKITDGTGTTLAACNASCGAGTGTGTSTGTGNGNVAGSDQLYNPLPTNSLTDTFLMILKAFLLIVAVWAVLFIIIGGFQMVMSAGNEEAVTKARKTITWAILGVVVALLSYSMIAIVQTLLQAKINYPT